MQALFIIFTSLVTLLWLSVYGYFLILWVIVRRRRQPDREISQYPDIAVIVPTLNEEEFILPKLEDIKLSDYPSERMTILVVDGGSTDQTTEIVAQEIERDQSLRLLHLEIPRGKPDQVRSALASVNQDIVVVTDADSTLETSCIRELVSHLIRNPELAIAGASIKPDSPLLEEQIHWNLVNSIWWLEGKALSAASISGVCYACRRKMVFPVEQKVRAEDIHLALTASCYGHPVHLSRTAWAVEHRVPQTTAEFIQFRRRRGGGYVSELWQVKPTRSTPSGYRIARLMRLWHFLITPKIVIGLALLSLALLFSPFMIWLIPAFIALAAPILIYLLASPMASGEKNRPLKLSWAAVRFFVFNSYAMLVLYFHPQKQGAIGGRL